MADVERSISKDDDLFHSVAMVEESLYQKGYEEGVEIGKKKGFQEGYKLGAQKGSELGREVGFYAGYATYIIKIYKDDTSKSRLIKLCNSIVTMAHEFCKLGPTDENLTESLNKLQSKFKQMSSLLGVKVEYKTAGASSAGVSF